MSYTLDNPSTALLEPYDQTQSSTDPLTSPKPRHPQRFSFLQGGKNPNPPRQDSGYNMGYGGYGGNPAMMQGRYGEPLDDDDDDYKRDESWENGGNGYKVG
ncbi:MAG TPA: hypothetical protein VGO47_07665, partial [Chlamydiales bacterium]|nr:hypothetical protein [Chlamydiales bacterium]